jgi:hypothetical protein
MGWWFLVIVAGCGERSELDGPCKTDAGCVSGLVCVKGSTSESAVDTCQIPCDANGMCDPGGCDECVEEPFADPPYCEFVGCS